MTHTFHNRKILLNRRRDLRRNQTDAEARLWYFLRGYRMRGLKFCRQYGVGPYILDFYCHEARLAIELDGGQHAAPAQVAYDSERTEFLIASGIHVLRFWNHDVLQSHELALDAIHEKLEEILP